MRLTMSTPAEKRLHIVRCVLFALFCVLLFRQLDEGKAEVVLEARTTEPTVFKMYWRANHARFWNESNVCKVRLTTADSRYSCKLIDLADIVELRIDPGESPTAVVTIQSLAITQDGYTPIRIAGDGLSRLVPGEGVKSARLASEGLVVTPAGDDPQLFFDLSGTRRRIASRGDELAALLGVFAFAFLGGLAFARFVAQGNAPVPLLLAATLVLIAAMASVSKVGEHPDELVHIRAGDYYQQHFLPPPVGSDEIRDTYSVYGVSRLHSGEAAYFFLGKFARFFHSLNIPSYLAQRYFNVTLWALLLVLTLAYGDFRPLMVPALLSPQIWYIFSYANSDAFAVFVMMLSAWQAAAPRSAWNRMLADEGEAGRSHWRACILLGLLFGMLLLLKKNFYFFLLFLGLYFIWRIVFGHTRLNRVKLGWIGIVCCIGFCLFGAARYTDAWVNDFHKKEKLLEARYQYAEPLWSPATPLEKRHQSLQKRDRGCTLRHMLTTDRWAGKSFQNSFGSYGWTSVNASPHYYWLVRQVGLYFLVVVTFIVLVYGGREGTTLWLMVLAVGGGLIALCLYRAWTVDFQAQGRYFFPIVGMLSVFVLQSRHYLFRPVVPLFCAALYLLSLYSFVCVGLSGIPKPL